MLLGCVIVAMLLANLPGTSLYYRHLLETDLSLMVHSPDGLIDWVFPRGMTVEKLINDNTSPLSGSAWTITVISFPRIPSYRAVAVSPSTVAAAFAPPLPAGR